MQGGVFLYPGTLKKPEGKLRLMYESAPLAFLAEQAGGKATIGDQSVLDVQPNQIHMRTPLIIGSAEDVALVESFLQERKLERSPLSSSATSPFATM
jgi:fructose-1,6-bisphosphatase I